MNRKLSGANMSVNELLSALTLAQKERDATLEELRKISDGERRKAEQAEERALMLQQDLEAANRNVEEFHKKFMDLENHFKLEKENYDKEIQKNMEEQEEKFNILKGKLRSMQQSLQENENSKSQISEELLMTKNRLQKALTSEEDTLCELKKVRDELTETKDDLNKSLKNQEILESELHMSKMQVLKENNINNRLLDELKRCRKDIDEYKDEISKLKKLRDHHRNSLTKQIKDLSILITENNKENYDDDLKEIRISLSTILKENFLLHNRINDVYKVLTKGDNDVVNVATQTSIGLDQMFSYENMDREVTNLVMKLREDLVNNKNDLVEMKQQNEMLKSLVREMKREKERCQFIEEEENRVEKLEDAVRSIKMMMQETEPSANGEKMYVDLLDQMRKDIDMLKGRVRRVPRQGVSREILDINAPPIKLVTSRR